MTWLALYAVSVFATLIIGLAGVAFAVGFGAARDFFWPMLRVSLVPGLNVVVAVLTVFECACLLVRDIQNAIR